VLTDEQVVLARKMRRLGCSYEEIAERFGVSLPGAWCAVVGLTWRYVPEPVRRRRYNRLTAAEVDKVKQLRASGRSQYQIALEVRRSRYTVRAILAGRRDGLAGNPRSARH
jgi:DNA-binding CsgD family transcriptional regulator